MTHRKITLRGFSYNLSDPDEFRKHASLVKYIGDSYMLREFRSFQIDKHNIKVLKFLIYYFNGCKEAEEVFPEENYKVHKNLLIVGNPGTGKTMLMQIFAEYLKETNNPNSFRNVSLTQMMNYQKINGHIDRFTFNETEDSKKYDGSPFALCLHDIGLATENQKSYGTQLTQIVDEFLFARYEIYQQFGIKYHLTSNLNVKEFKRRFESRLVDRFKSFNVIELSGSSRRK